MAQRKRQRATATDGVVVALPYGRVSTDEQGEAGLSLPNQRATILEYAARHGWPAEEWQQDIESGLKPSRSGYQAVLARARDLAGSDRRCVLIVTRVDRLGRQLGELVRSREELARLGVAVHYVQEGGELPEFMANIFGSMAQEESRRTSARVSEIIARCHHGGWRFPGRVPWGYRGRPATADERAAGAPASVLEVDEVAAPNVAETFQRVARGEPLRHVCRWLASLPVAARGGRVLSRASLRAVLTSPTPCGLTPDGKPGRWPAVVSRDVWDAVQARLAPGARGLPPQASQRYLLTGLLRCPRCGARMAGSADRAGSRHRYRCTSALIGARHTGPACNFVMTCRLLEPAVLAQVEPVILGAPAVLRAEVEAEARAMQDAPADDARTLERATWEAQRATCQQEVSGLTRALARGAISDEAYSLAVADATANLRGAEQRLAAMDDEEAGGDAPDLAALVTSADVWPKVWQAGRLEDRRAVLAELVQTIRPLPNPTRRRVATAQITWTITGEYLRSLLGLPAIGQPVAAEDQAATEEATD